MTLNLTYTLASWIFLLHDADLALKVVFLHGELWASGMKLSDDSVQSPKGGIGNFGLIILGKTRTVPQI